jgi:hypothetical protein
LSYRFHLSCKSPFATTPQNPGNIAANEDFFVTFEKANPGRYKAYMEKASRKQKVKATKKVCASNCSHIRTMPYHPHMLALLS